MPSIATASRWVLVTSNEFASVEVDMESFRYAAGKTKVWARWNYTKAQSVPGYSSRPFKQAVELELMHCAERVEGTIQATYYVENGGESVGGFDIASGLPKMAEVIPDSMGETLFNFACVPYKFPASGKK